jgi:predicted transcriptional regulator
MSITNANRLRTKKAISLFPGVHLRLLQRMTKTSFNTTRYHVRNLELAGEIVCSKEGGHERLYPAGLGEKERALHALMLDKTTRKIIETLLKNPALGNGELAQATKAAKSTVSEHIDVLRDAGLVRRNIAVDGGVSYELLEKEEVARLLGIFRANLLTSVADSFVDLWDI